MKRVGAIRRFVETAATRRTLCATLHCRRHAPVLADDVVEAWGVT